MTNESYRLLLEYIIFWTHKKRTSGKGGTDFVVIEDIGKIDVKT